MGNRDEYLPHTGYPSPLEQITCPPHSYAPASLAILESMLKIKDLQAKT